MRRAGNIFQPRLDSNGRPTPPAIVVQRTRQPHNPMAHYHRPVVQSVTPHRDASFVWHDGDEGLNQLPIAAFISTPKSPTSTALKPKLGSSNYDIYLTNIININATYGEQPNIHNCFLFIQCAPINEQLNNCYVQAVKELIGVVDGPDQSKLAFQYINYGPLFKYNCRCNGF